MNLRLLTSFGATAISGFALLTSAHVNAQPGADSKPVASAETPPPTPSAPAAGAAPLPSAPPVAAPPAPPVAAPPVSAAPVVAPAPATAPTSPAPVVQTPAPAPPAVVVPTPPAASTTPAPASPAPVTPTPISEPTVAAPAVGAVESVEVQPQAAVTVTTTPTTNAATAVAPAVPVTEPTAVDPAVKADAPKVEQQRKAAVAQTSGNLGSQFDLRPYSRAVVKGFGYSGFVQAQYLYSQLSEDQLQQGNIPYNRDQFSLRSARLRVEQGYEYTAFGFELDASTTRPQLLSLRRAEATVFYRGGNPNDVAPLIALSAGIIDLPFGFEVAESVRTRLYMERTTASLAFFPTQNDVGLRLFGAWRFARYAFALVNGEPFGGTDWPSDPNAAKDLLGRLGAEGTVAEKVAISGGASFAFGKGFHAGRPMVKDTLFWRDDNKDGIATSTEIVGVPGSSASKSSNFERFALGVDLELQVVTPLGSSRIYGEAYAASNHDRGLFVSDPVTSGADIRQLGAYVAVSQDLTEYAFVAARADLYDPNSDLFEQRRGEFVPASQSIVTWSPAIGLVLPRRARLLAQYDFTKDFFARDKLGVPSDAKNNQLTVRLQVEL